MENLMKTRDEYIDLIKDVGKHHAEAIAEGTFMPAVAYHIEDDRPRLVMFPEILPTAEARNKLAWSMKVLGAGVDNLQTIVFTMDTYHTTHPTKKNGERWGLGEMQEAVMNQTEDAELVYDALAIQIMHNDGQRAMATLPYVIKDGEVEFAFDRADVIIHEDGSETRLEGAFIDMMLDAFKGPKLMEEMTETFGEPEVFGLTEDEARIHAMAVAVKLVMMKTGTRCLVPVHTVEEQERIKHSFEGGPFSEGIKIFDRDQLDEIVTLEKAFEKPAFDKLGLTNQGDVTQEE